MRRRRKSEVRGQKSEVGAEGAILIGGQTTHDETEGALLAIVGEWASSRSLAQRVARITQGVGAGAWRLTLNGTITGDSVRNLLAGGAGEDWVFKYHKDSLVDIDELIDEITE